MPPLTISSRGPVMKAYLLVTGTIFALFAVAHVFITYEHWRRDSSDLSFLLGSGAIAVCGGVLALWAFRLTRSTTGAT